MKKQDEVSQTHATETIPDDHGDARDRLFHEIVRDGRSIPGFDALERKEVLPLLAHVSTENGGTMPLFLPSQPAH